MGNFNDYSQVYECDGEYSFEYYQTNFMKFILEFHRCEEQRLLVEKIAMEQRRSLLKRKRGRSCQRLIEPIDEIDDQSHSMMDLVKTGDRKWSDYRLFRKQLKQLLSNTKIEGNPHKYIEMLQELQYFYRTWKKSARKVIPKIDYMEID